MTFLLAGCLIEPPPEFGPPSRSAPDVFEARVDPPLFLPLLIDTTDPNVRSIPFNIPFQAQAPPGEVMGNAWLNYGTSQEASLNHRPPERPDADSTPGGNGGAAPLAAERKITFNLVPQRINSPGSCARLTVFVHYVDDFDIESGKPRDEAFEQGRVAQIHWWLVIDAAPADVSFADCPTPSETLGVSGP